MEAQKILDQIRDLLYSISDAPKVKRFDISETPFLNDVQPAPQISTDEAVAAAFAGATAQQVFGCITELNKAEALIAPAWTAGMTVNHGVLGAVLVEIRKARAIIS